MSSKEAEKATEHQQERNPAKATYHRGPTHHRTLVTTPWEFSAQLRHAILLHEALLAITATVGGKGHLRTIIRDTKIGKDRNCKQQKVLRSSYHITTEQEHRGERAASMFHSNSQ